MTNRQFDLEGLDSLPALSVPYDEAVVVIDKQIIKGEELECYSHESNRLLHQAERKYNKWNKENFHMLKGFFNTPSLANEYSFSEWTIGRILISELNLQQKSEKLCNNIKDKIDKLKSIRASLELFKDQEIRPQKQVLFLHLGDDANSLKIIDYLEYLDFDVVILNDKHKQGYEIYEEILNTDIKYAVVFLTKPSRNTRKLINLILELGIVIGKFDKQRITCLYDSNAVIPDGHHGVRYTKMDVRNKWQKILHLDLANAGYEV